MRMEQGEKTGHSERKIMRHPGIVATSLVGRTLTISLTFWRDFIFHRAVDENCSFQPHKNTGSEWILRSCSPPAKIIDISPVLLSFLLLYWHFSYYFLLYLLIVEFKADQNRFCSNTDGQKLWFWYSTICNFFRLTPEVWLREDKINKKYPATNLQTADNNGGWCLANLNPNCVEENLVAHKAGCQIWQTFIHSSRRSCFSS